MAMTLEYELKSLSELRKMSNMSKKEISEKYMTPIDTADDYFKMRVGATLDVVMDSLRYDMQKDAENEGLKGF